MSKRAISVTISHANLTWLKGRTGAIGARSVSELLDQLVSAARGSNTVGASRSVRGTIDVDVADPNLDTADDAIRVMYEQSVRRPLLVRDAPPQHQRYASKSSRRRG